MVNATLPLGPTLETARLILRPPAAEDLGAFTAMMADEACARYMGGVMSRQAAWRAWSAVTGAWVINGFSMFSVIEKRSGKWIGRVGPWQPADWPAAEVGWALVQEAWGKGYATEAATRAIDWVFDTLGWTEVAHCIHPENANSIAVAKRLGSQWVRSARFPPPMEHLPTEIYGQALNTWRGGRGTR
ncbi:MAG TPA: GNAT family N-acetyltransferase [Alphaproteobacteria bacterium]|nr:GNAT family N-acetyltransferase [Alphaproteobacteria bacterium]